MVKKEQQTSVVSGVTDFSELRVYREALDLADETFRTTRQWPKRETYGMTDQILRSSRSVCANIGEAWFKRKYPKHFASKLSDANSEAAETIVWIHLAVRSGYLDRETGSKLEGKYRKVIGGISRMIHQSNKWCNL